MWLILSLGAAIFNALEGIASKRSGLHFNTFITTWAILVISALAYLPILLNVPIPSHLDSTFWIAVALRLIVDSAALLLYVKSLRMAPISLATPMTALSPVLVMLLSIPVNHTIPSLIGILAVGIIITGVYLLHFERGSHDLLAPFKALTANRGVMLALIAVLLWSAVTILKRLAIDHSDVLFYTSFFQAMWAVAFTPVAIIASRQQFKKLFSIHAVTHLLPVGILDGAQVLAQNIALGQTVPAYASAVRTTTILFSAVFAWWFFKEKIRSRILPIILLITGVVIISLAH